MESLAENPFADLLAKMDEAEDKDATITFLRSEVSRLQDRVSQLGAQIADQGSLQAQHDAKSTWNFFRRPRKPKTIPKGRT